MCEYGSRIVSILLAGLACALGLPAGGHVLQVPPFPKNLDLSSVERLYKSGAYKVEVRPSGTTEYVESFVFETRNDWVLLDFFGKDPTRVIRAANELGNGKGDVRTASFAQFSFADTAVDVRVTLLAPGAVARSVKVRPLRHDIPATIGPDGKTILFRLASPLKVSVEINDRLNPLFLFTDKPDVPDPAATYYFGPGLHRLPGNGQLTLTSGQHVYIAAGAIVEGRFVLADRSSDIRIAGRGILSTGEWPHTSTKVSFLVPYSTIRSRATSRFVLEGLTMVQGTGWTVAIDSYPAHATHDNVYQNIKMIHWAGNTDAFWITGDRNRLEDSFAFNNDDAIVTKGGEGSVVSNLVFWGGVWGRMVLFQNNGVDVSNLTIENVDVIHKEGGPQLILAESGRRPIELRNVTFRNIRFEERNNIGSYNKQRLFWIHNFAGSLHNWLFEDITLDQQFADEGAIQGSAEQSHEGIMFKNLRMGGKLILSQEASHISTNQHVSGLRFLPGDSKANGRVPPASR